MPKNDGSLHHESSRLRRPKGSRMGLAAFGIILLVATLAVPLLVGASTYRTGNELTFGQAETFDENAYLAASRVTFNGRAAQDVNLVAANAHVGGTIGGSLNILAGTADITSRVAGSVHVAGGNVEVGGTIEGDLLVGGGNVRLTRGSTIRGDLILTGGNVTLRGTIDGNVYGSALSFTNAGTVRGDVDVQASDIEIQSGAQIGGDLRYQSAQEADIASSTAVTGQIDRTNSSPWQGVDDGALRPFGILLRTTWALILGAAIIALVPRLATRVAEHAEPFLRPMVLGLVAVIGIPLLAIIALVTIVGIPLGLLLLLGLALGLYLSQIFVGLTLGRYVLPRSWRDGSRGFSLLAMTIGVIAIGAVRMVPFPFIGALVALVVALWGLGASISLVGDLTSRKSRMGGGIGAA